MTPVISGITINNGVNYYTEDVLCDDELFESELTISTRGEYSGTVFYHDGRFALANNILVMKMLNLTRNQKIFIGSIINTLPNGGYSGYPRKETLAVDMVYLPVKNGEIDYLFMGKFIAELEAYLTTAGLKDYELTPQEQKALDSYQNLEFIDFKVTDIFTVKNSGNILSRDIVKNSGNTPYLCASRENNSVSSYISYDSKYLDNGNCIFIGGKTFVVTYQEYDFYSNDSHNLILYLKNKNNRDKLTQLYLATCINKSLGHKYSWGDSHK